jgi:hypothetical protein
MTTLALFCQVQGQGELPQQAAAALQQLLAQQLPLQRLHFLGFDLPVLDMSRLNKLTDLDTYYCQLPAASVLPAQLQQLRCYSISNADSLAPVTRLQLKQLQHLEIRVESIARQQQLQLAQLPALQHLELLYHCPLQIAVAVTAGTASAWPLLPQLRNLHIESCSAEQERATVLAGLSAATSLTQLNLHIYISLTAAAAHATSTKR